MSTIIIDSFHVYALEKQRITTCIARAAAEMLALRVTADDGGCICAHWLSSEWLAQDISHAEVVQHLLLCVEGPFRYLDLTSRQSRAAIRMTMAHQLLERGLLERESNHHIYE